MENNSFQQFVSSLDTLNSVQYRVLKTSLEKHDEKKKTANSLKENKRIVCPHCDSQHYSLWSVRNDLQRYRCKACKRTFNELTDTPLARLRKKGKWLEFISCLIEGTSVREAAKRCGIHRNTAFKWRHRFLQNPKSIAPQVLAGVVELIDYQILHSCKGSKKLDRPPRKRGISTPEYKTKHKLVTVFSARDRNMNTANYVLTSLSLKQLKKNLKPLINKDILLCSDSKEPYLNLSKDEQLPHGKLQIDKGITVQREVVHIENLTKYTDELKVWMKRFRGVATKYLDAYLGWYRNLEEFNFNLPPLDFLLRAKSPRPYIHQPLNVTEQNNDAEHQKPPTKPTT